MADTWESLASDFGGSASAAPARAAPDAWAKLNADVKAIQKLTNREVIAKKIDSDAISTGARNFAGDTTPDWERRLAQLGSGFDSLRMGVKGLFATGAADTAVRSEVADKRGRDRLLNDDFTGKSLAFGGETLPTLVVPAGWAGKLGKAAPLVEGGVTGAAIGGLAPVAGDESRAANAALAAFGGTVLPGAVMGARKLAAPSADAAATAALAEKYSVPMGVADTSSSKMVQAARSVMNDLPLTGMIGGAQREAQQGALNAAVGKTFWADGAKLTPDVVGAARGKIGTELDRLWNQNAVHVDPQMLSALQSLKANAGKLPQGESGRLQSWITDLESQIQPGPNMQAMIPGDVANRFQSKLGKEASKATGFLADDLGTLRRELIGAFNRSVGGADAKALTDARGAYKAFKTVEPLLDKGAVGTAGRAAGDVPYALLPEAVRKSYSGLSSATTQPPLADLAQIASRLADRVPQTGGSARALIQNGGLMGAAGYGALHNPTAAAVAIPSTAALQWALGNPAVRRLLTKNPAAARGLLDNPELFPALAEAGLLGAQRGMSQGALSLMPAPALE